MTKILFFFAARCGPGGEGEEGGGGGTDGHTISASQQTIMSKAFYCNAHCSSDNIQPIQCK